MVVVFCTPSDDCIHIISFRKANRREVKTKPSDIDWAAVDAAPLADPAG